MKKVAGVCAVVIAFVVVSSCIQSKQGYVTRGNRLYDAGKYADASLNYRKAIQKDPDFGEAYYRLGLAAIKESRTLEAYNALLRAIELLPNNLDAKEKFADVCLGAYLSDPKRPQLLYGHLTDLSTELLAANPKSYEGLMLKGYLNESDRKTEDAIDFFHRALRINSSDPGVVTELVLLLLQNGQTQDAEKVSRELIDQQKTPDGRIYDVMYEHYRNSGRPSEAEKVLKAKVQNNPKNADYILQLARYYFQQQKPSEMTAVLRRLLDNPKDFADARLWVGDFYMGLRNFPEAIRYYQEGVRASSSDANRKTVYQNKTLVALLAEGKRDEAFRSAQQLLRENPNDLNALRLEADLLLDRGRPDDLDAALKAFQKLQASHPEDAVIRFHLGRVYQRKGDLDSARAQFADSVRLNRNFLQAKYSLAEISLDQQRPLETIQQANEILAAHPDDRQARLLRVRGFIQTGNGTAARAELNRLSLDAPKDNESALLLASLALNERKYPEAVRILEKLRAAGELRAFAPLATAYLSQRQFDKAIEVLQAGLKLSPDSPLMLGQLGSIEALRGQYDFALAQFRKLLDLNPRSIQNRVRIAEVYDLKGQHDEAVAMYRTAYEMEPNNLALAIAVADALARAGHGPEAMRLYRGVLKAHPENEQVLNNMAYLLADAGGNLDEALRMAQHALAKQPGEANVSDTIGYIYLKKGLLDSAIQTFGNLAKKNPNNPSYRFHLGLALYQKGDKAAARKELQTALTDHPSDKDERRIKDLLKKLG